MINIQKEIVIRVACFVIETIFDNMGTKKLPKKKRVSKKKKPRLKRVA